MTPTISPLQPNFHNCEAHPKKYTINMGDNRYCGHFANAI